MGRTVRNVLRRFLPFRLRRELVIVRRLPRWIAERGPLRLSRANNEEATEYAWMLAAHSSPLNRTPGAIADELQQGKEANVALAASLLDRLIIGPNQTFSHHHAIGRTTRRRGFRKGMELQNEESTVAWGGGLCQVSNSFYWVALRAGMRIVERHRHGLDLFPDDERTVPFGCGATVVYNYADFRFENPFPAPVLMRSRVEQGQFLSELWMTHDPGVRIEVEEVEHRFYKAGGQWMRENRLRRRIADSAGNQLSDVEVAHNQGRVIYEPAEEQG